MSDHADTDFNKPRKARAVFTEPVQDKQPAAERLRALEDEWFGKDAPRHDGRIEQGHGSQFATLAPEWRTHYAAVVALADAEAKVDKARSDLSIAEGEYNVALKRADDSIPQAPVDPNAPKETPPPDTRRGRVDDGTVRP